MVENTYGGRNRQEQADFDDRRVQKLATLAPKMAEAHHNTYEEKAPLGICKNK